MNGEDYGRRNVARGPERTWGTLSSLLSRVRRHLELGRKPSVRHLPIEEPADSDTHWSRLASTIIHPRQRTSFCSSKTYSSRFCKHSSIGGNMKSLAEKKGKKKGRGAGREALAAAWSHRLRPARNGRRRAQRLRCRSRSARFTGLGLRVKAGLLCRSGQVRSGLLLGRSLGP